MLLVCIDDTDSLDSPGTGKLAQVLASELTARGIGATGRISRHQLYVHPDIPYTSHNSAMCFPLLGEYPVSAVEQVVGLGQRFLVENSAYGSDPGLCVLNTSIARNWELLVDYGLKAKKQVLNKKMAYSLAGKESIHLSEHGGTGQGVVGALAGVALRYGGNDGRFKGNHLMPSSGDWAVNDIINHTGVDSVEDSDGLLLSGEALVFVPEGVRLKSILRDHRESLVVKKISCCSQKDNGASAAWLALDKEEMRVY